MQPTKTTAEIKKFGYEVGEGYVLLVKLSEELKRLEKIYRIDIHPFLSNPSSKANFGAKIQFLFSYSQNSWFFVGIFLIATNFRFFLWVWKNPTLWQDFLYLITYIVVGLGKSRYSFHVSRSNCAISLMK